MFLKGLLTATLLFSCTQATHPNQAPLGSNESSCGAECRQDLITTFDGPTEERITSAGFRLPAEAAEKYGCGKECQQVLAATTAMDDFLTGAPAFDHDFYATAANFSTSKPGDALKLQPLNATDLTINPGVSIYRFQYTSSDLDGSPIPVTGFIAFPFGKPRGGKFRVVAFAHASIGAFARCAPSNGAELFDYQTWSPLVSNGYAVVATDYAGLGNDYVRHKILSNLAHAYDLYYSVLAARQLFPDLLTLEWISMGHSQGGGAVWKLSELPQVQSPESGYLGTVAHGPDPKIYDLAIHWSETIYTSPEAMESGLTAEMPIAALSVKGMFPDYDYSFLGKKMKRRMGLVEEFQLCTNGVMNLVNDLAVDDVVSVVDLQKDSFFQKAQDLNAPASGDRTSQPMLIVEGLHDVFCLPESVVKSYSEACAYGNEIDLLMYPGVTHTGAVGTSAPEWLKWIRDRFDGVARPPGCTNTTVEPFNLDLANTPLDWGKKYFGLK